MKNIIFIWIPKTAGSTIQHLFGIQKKKRVGDALRVVQRKQLSNLVTFGHLNVLKLNFLPTEYKPQNTYNFCFCRNPYDRVVSAYAYESKGHGTLVSSKIMFLDFCRNLSNFVPSYSPFHRHPANAYNPQVRWVENINLDFIGRFENLEADIKKLAVILNKKVENIPHINGSKRKADYKGYYCTESKQIVEHFYAEDFKYFNYEREQF